MTTREKLLAWMVFGLLAWGGLLLFALFILAGCGGVRHGGYAMIGAYPRHNEAVDGQTDKIVKWKSEIKEQIRWNQLELEINPIVRLGNEWPEGSYSWTWDTAVLEGNIEGRIYLIPSTAIYYRKTRHWLVGYKEAITDREACQCTYWNEIGVRYEW